MSHNDDPITRLGLTSNAVRVLGVLLERAMRELPEVERRAEGGSKEARRELVLLRRKIVTTQAKLKAYAEIEAKQNRSE